MRRLLHCNRLAVLEAAIVGDDHGLSLGEPAEDLRVLFALSTGADQSESRLAVINDKDPLHLSELH